MEIFRKIGTFDENHFAYLEDIDVGYRAQIHGYRNYFCHDAYYEKKGNKDNIENYKNSKNFVKAIKIARNYEKSHDKLVIIAGACQSDYEALIKAGANFASSPKRVNIHALDPAIIATTLATTARDEPIDLIQLLSKTKNGKDGIGGIQSNGLMYIGYPRE